MTTDIRDTDKGFNPNQHCTNEYCYTFSHTAQWCGNPQPRRCGCPYDYAEEPSYADNFDVRDDLVRILSEVEDGRSDKSLSEWAEEILTLVGKETS